MKATVRLNNYLIEVEGETQKELFAEMARASEVFGESKCGLCGSQNIRPVVRCVTQGKKVYEYHEYHCQEQNCRARLALSQNMEGGTLYPVRKLLENGKPATGDDVVNGKYSKSNGWTKYRGEPKEDTK